MLLICPIAYSACALLTDVWNAAGFVCVFVYFVITDIAVMNCLEHMGDLLIIANVLFLEG
jgi:hypothetical protein